MARTTVAELSTMLDELRQQMAQLVARIDHIESKNGKPAAAPASAPAPVAKPPEPKPEPVSQAITEEELLAISACVAAFMGERVRIRSIRVIASPAWAQVGRVTIQASHRLH